MTERCEPPVGLRGKPDDMARSHATAAEVEALRAEVVEWRAVNEALGINANQPAMTAAHNARALRAERDALQAERDAYESPAWAANERLNAELATLRATVRELADALEAQSLLLFGQRNTADLVHSITSSFGTKTAVQIMEDAHAALSRAKEARL